MVYYKCPECGGRMEVSQFPTYPPKHEAECTNCGARYREEPKQPPLEPLPTNFKPFVVPKRKTKNKP